MKSGVKRHNSYSEAKVKKPWQRRTTVQTWCDTGGAIRVSQDLSAGLDDLGGGFN